MLSARVATGILDIGPVTRFINLDNEFLTSILFWHNKLSVSSNMYRYPVGTGKQYGYTNYRILKNYFRYVLYEAQSFRFRFSRGMHRHNLPLSHSFFIFRRRFPDFRLCNLREFRSGAECTELPGRPPHQRLAALRHFCPARRYFRTGR